MDNLHHLCIGFDNWTQVGFDSEDPKFSFGARQLEKGARPADVFIPGWAGGRAAALDVTVVHPLQDATRARAAVEPGYALSYAYTNKMRGTADLCDQQGIAFIPIVAESMGGLHNIAIQQLRKLGSALARHTGTDESESINHLMTRTSILLQKGLSALLLNRIPNHPAPDIGGEL